MRLPTTPSGKPAACLRSAPHIALNLDAPAAAASSQHLMWHGSACDKMRQDSQSSCQVTLEPCMAIEQAAAMSCAGPEPCRWTEHSRWVLVLGSRV